MTVPELGARLRLSAVRIRTLHQRGELPVRPIQTGRRLLFVREEVDRYLAGLMAARD